MNPPEIKVQVARAISFLSILEMFNVCFSPFFFNSFKLV